MVQSLDHALSQKSGLQTFGTRSLKKRQFDQLVQTDLVPCQKGAMPREKKINFFMCRLLFLSF